MKKLFFFLILCNFILFSQEKKIIQNNDILIEYSYSPVILINKKNIGDFNYSFYNEKDNYFKLELFNKLNSEKIISIETEKRFYLELIFDSKKNRIHIKNLLGEFKITSFNSFFDNFLEIGDFRIFNFYSSYKIISLPKNNIFIYVNEGKINVLKNKESLILITGETCETKNNIMTISDISDFETGRIILLTKFKAGYLKKELNDIEKIFY
ncbi:MAG TPA: hypothetical protein PK771_02890 [Spirochaetota bacterium]|nr:hypothetical protein [Spirochaetota bacterium]